MKHTIPLILIFLFFSYITKALEINDTVIFKKASLIIEKKKIVDVLFIPGDFIVTNRYLYFNPKGKKVYIKKITLPIDSIKQIIDNPINNFIIEMKDGCNYQMVCTKKRKLLKMLDSLVRGSSFKNKIINKTTLTPQVYTTKIKMNCWGSTIYLPFCVNGVIEKNENNILFRPIEYECYVKTLKINTKEINRIKKRYKSRLIVRMNDGDKYIFITSNREQLLNVFK